MEELTASRLQQNSAPLNTLQNCVRPTLALTYSHFLRSLLGPPDVSPPLLWAASELLAIIMSSVTAAPCSWRPLVGSYLHWKECESRGEVLGKGDDPSLSESYKDCLTAQGASGWSCGSAGGHLFWEVWAVIPGHALAGEGGHSFWEEKP